MERCIIVEGSEAAREKEDNNEEEEEEDEESGKVLLLPRYHLGPKSARLRLMPVDFYYYYLFNAGKSTNKNRLSIV